MRDFGSCEHVYLMFTARHVVDMKRVYLVSVSAVCEDVSGVHGGVGTPS